MRDILKIHPRDNVAVALRPLTRGQVVEGIELVDDIPAGHKLALQALEKGSSAIKFGHPIGAITLPVRPGQHVHSHNLKSALRGNLSGKQFSSTRLEPNRREDGIPLRFEGYRRPDGKVGIRNEIWIVNTVGCVNHSAERIARAASQQWVRPGSPVEGIHAFPHPYGCAQLGEDLLATQKILAGLVRHPNAAAILLLGLGCENNQIRSMLGQIGTVDPQRVLFFNAQEVSDEVKEGLRCVAELAEYASRFHREPMDSSELIMGMKCGGSDGFSGITANPLVGRVADRLCRAGATVLLSEVPEMFGAEDVLLERAANKGVFDSTLEMVNQFRDYFRQHQQPIDENPAPGNKEGGITTLAEKSLGCVQKGGRAAVTQVLDYGELALPQTGGLALVKAPGNDGVSGTALTVAGAHLLLFTTGRGNPMGFPAPTLKLATNTALARRKPSWIDFDAGVLAEESISIDDLAEQLLQMVLEVASGKTQTRNETHGYREIAIWKNGVTV